MRYEPATYAVTPGTVTMDSTCINMTRSLGDFYANQFGIIAKPSIKIQKLDSKVDYYMFTASDGVWDSWKFGDFSNFVRNSVLRSGETLKL